jgi:hypothetical protein
MKMAGRVAGWLLTTELRMGPGGRVSLGSLIRDRQPWRFPLEATALGMAVLVEGEPGQHELGFAISYGDEVVAPPLIINVNLLEESGWLFLDRGPHTLPGPGTYHVDISLDGEIAAEAHFELVKLEVPKLKLPKKKKAAEKKEED